MFLFGNTHHLKLACKGALSSQMFIDVTEILLGLYISTKNLYTGTRFGSSTLM